MADPDLDIRMPPHVYVPGLSPGHPRSLFEGLKATVHADVPASELHQTQAFVAGVRFFHAGYFWECHDVLDAVWMQTSDPSPERDMVLALIQLANARLKVLMRQPGAARRLCDMVETHLSRCPSDRAVLGLWVKDMLDLVQDARRIIKTAMQSPSG